MTVKPHTLSGTEEDLAAWENTLRAGVIAQSLVGGIAVGGTASAIYAGHRLSADTDHLLMNLREHFDDVLEKLSESPEWKTARLKRPVLILGAISNCEVGFRQSIRSTPIDTVEVETNYGVLTVPTLDEMIGMKAYLAYHRTATRDFLDFAALSECTSESEVLESLMKLDERYGASQTNSVRLEVSRTLIKPSPVDLEGFDLAHYKALRTEWHDWSRTATICEKFGLMLGEKTVVE